MSSVSSVRIPGLATGMDTDSMVKEMLTGDQSKIDKVDQKKQTTTWQQESYREIISNVKGFYDKYFSATSSDFILSSKVFSTTTVSSSNNNIISAIAGAGTGNVNYNFEVEKLAKAPEMISNQAKNGVDIKKDSKLSELELPAETSFKINYGKDKESKPITITPDDTVESLMKKINDSTSGEIKASYSEMTGSFTITSKTTGEASTLRIVNLEKGTDDKLVETDKSDALSFMGIDGAEKKDKTLW